FAAPRVVRPADTVTNRETVYMAIGREVTPGFAGLKHRHDTRIGTPAIRGILSCGRCRRASIRRSLPRWRRKILNSSPPGRQTERPVTLKTPHGSLTPFRRGRSGQNRLQPRHRGTAQGDLRTGISRSLEGAGGSDTCWT